MVEDEVSLMVRIHVDDTIVSGEQDACDKFFARLKERFLVKIQGEMYIFCAFVRDWESGVLESDRICRKPGAAVRNLCNRKHPG